MKLLLSHPNNIVRRTFRDEDIVELKDNMVSAPRVNIPDLNKHNSHVEVTDIPPPADLKSYTYTFRNNEFIRVLL